MAFDATEALQLQTLLMQARWDVVKCSYNACFLLVEREECFSKHRELTTGNVFHL